MLRVAQLAIHLDRDVNDKGVVLNKQEHLAPIFGLEKEGAKNLATMLAEELGVAPERIVGSELMLYDVVTPTLGGRDEEMIFSARLDNLAMSHAAIRAIVDAAPSAGAGELVPVAALFDHEEVGSETAYGAQSGFFRARSSASSWAVAARARTSTARSPARSAYPPTWRMRFTRTTNRATNRGTSPS